MEKTEMKKRRRAYKKYNWKLHAKMVQIADMLKWDWLVARFHDNFLEIMKGEDKHDRH
jgi:hypothetical protein